MILLNTKTGNETEILNKKTTKRKEGKEETQKLDIDNKNNVIDKSDAKYK